MAANHSAPGLNSGQASNFWWLKSSNHVKFSEEYGMWMAKHFLGKRKSPNGLNMDLATESLIQKDSSWSGNRLTLVKKKFQV